MPFDATPSPLSPLARALDQIDRAHAMAKRPDWWAIAQSCAPDPNARHHRPMWCRDPMPWSALL